MHVYQLSIRLNVKVPLQYCILQ